jgi:hypothetical protein
MSDQPSSICSAASPVSLLPLNSQASELLASLNGTKQSGSCSPNGSPACPSTETSEPLTEPSFAERMDGLMSLQVASLANLRLLSDSCAELLASVGCGPKPHEWCAKHDPTTSSLRTRQRCLLSNPGEPGTELCQDWSRSGMICGGMYFPLPRLVQGISESASSSLVPTPRASANEARQTKLTPSQQEGTHGLSLQAHLISRLLPTPCAADGQNGGRGDLLAIVKGRPNKHWGTAYLFESQRDDQLPLTPEFLSWLMGFPTDWVEAASLCAGDSVVPQVIYPFAKAIRQMLKG